jgi:hypothetical protein
MNYTESFNEFASRVTTLDLALYAGVGLVLWVLFKDRMSPVQKFVSDLVSKIKSPQGGSQLPALPTINVPVKSDNKNEDVFFKLIASWKQTRDLAVQSNCSEAIKVIDQIFPYLSPNACVPPSVSVDQK